MKMPKSDALICSYDDYNMITTVAARILKVNSCLSGLKTTDALTVLAQLLLLHASRRVKIC